MRLIRTSVEQPTKFDYLYAVTRLAKYYRRPPDQLDKEQIRSYLVHLTVEKKLSPNTMTGQISGLRFFYNETLGWDETKLFIPPRKKSSPLPEVFSPSEVVRQSENFGGRLGRAKPALSPLRTITVLQSLKFQTSDTHLPRR